MRAYALAITVIAFVVFQDEDVRKTVPDAKEIKKTSRKLDDEGRKKVEEALGEKLTDDDLKEPICEAMAVVAEVGGSEPVGILWMAVNVKGPKGWIRVAVARAAEEPVVVQVAVLKAVDVPGAAEKVFLAQFESYLLSENLHQPPAKLEESKKAEGLTQVLLGTSVEMSKVGIAWHQLEIMLPNNNAAGKAEAEKVVKAFEAVTPLVAKYEHLKEGQRERFAKNLSDSLKEVKKLPKLIEDGKFVDARQILHEVGEQCSKCHSGTRKLFRPARAERGIGNGNFAIGIDLAASGAEFVDAQQAVAKGVRKALLILAEAK